MHTARHSHIQKGRYRKSIIGMLGSQPYTVIAISTSTILASQPQPQLRSILGLVIADLYEEQNLHWCDCSGTRLLSDFLA